ncbi:MAG: LysR family transcriptional regulator [Clostridia bacterium]
MIDVKLLTLLGVCEAKSFTKAAEKLSLTQPAVSQHIKQLESELGIKIFNRGGNEIRLTDEGIIVEKYARRLNSLYDNLSRALNEQKRQIKNLSIGITHTSESNAVAEVIAKYGATKNGVHITLIAESITNLYDMLRNYEIDIAIMEGQSASGEFNSVLLDTDFLVLAIPSNHPLAKKSMITINELKKEKLILRLPNSGTRNLFISHLESRNLSIDDFNVILEVNNIATIKDLIRRGFGVSILAKSVCLDELKKGKIAVLPIENLSMIRDINIVYLPDFEHLNILNDLTRLYKDTMNLYK